MRAKLIKTDSNNFVLETNNGFLSGTLEPSCFEYKLSLKNCQAIERGYDLDELAKNEYRNFPNKANGEEPLPRWGEDQHATKKQKAYKKGFMKALELLGDKKFSEDDVKKRVELVKEQFRKDVNAYGKPKKIMSTLDTIHQPLQQNEWDVIVEIEESHEYEMCSNPKDHTSCLILKLDEDGCIILKNLDEKLPRN